MCVFLLLHTICPCICNSVLTPPMDTSILVVGASVFKSSLMICMYGTPHDPLRGKHFSDGLFKFHEERRDQVLSGETSKQSSAEPDLFDDEGGSGHRGSHG